VGGRRQGRGHSPQGARDRQAHGRGHRGDEIERNVYYLDGMAKWIAGYGPDVLVLEPDVLAKAVHERLSALAHPGGDRR